MLLPVIGVGILTVALAVPDPARSQEPMDQWTGMEMQMQMPMPMPMPMPQHDGERNVHIRVRFHMLVPLGTGGGDAAARAEAKGRAAIYRMAEEECAVLKSTIAATCQMTGIRIRSTARARHREPSSFLNVTGNARFAITLKET
jgi:hypothetical protein